MAIPTPPAAQQNTVVPKVANPSLYWVTRITNPPPRPPTSRTSPNETSTKNKTNPSGTSAISQLLATTSHRSPGLSSENRGYIFHFKKIRYAAIGSDSHINVKIAFMLSGKELIAERRDIDGMIASIALVAVATPGIHAAISSGIKSEAKNPRRKYHPNASLIAAEFSDGTEPGSLIWQDVTERSPS
jgi:hypothetical protein